MNIEKAKAELQAAMTGQAGKNWSYGPAVKTLLNELAAKDAELQEYRKAAQPLTDLERKEDGLRRPQKERGIEHDPTLGGILPKL